MHSLRIIDSVGDQYLELLRDAVLKGLSFRIVGDNINWATRVHDERLDRHGKMNNAFSSVALVQTVYFDDLAQANERPSQVSPLMYLWNSEEVQLYRSLCIDLVCSVLRQHIPALGFLPTEGLYVNEHANKLVSQTPVIILPILFEDEMKYEDVLQIMDWYEQLICKVYGKEAHIPNVHVGGDQMTRDRLSGGKRLRACAETPSLRYEHLSPITFEFFHLQMNVLGYIFKTLYTKQSSGSVGSMYTTAVRLNRKEVNGDVKAKYDAHRDYAVSFTDAHIVEAALQFFGMESVLSSPTLHWQSNTSGEEKLQWTKSTIGEFVDAYVLNEAMLKMGCSTASISGR